MTKKIMYIILAVILIAIIFAVAARKQSSTYAIDPYSAVYEIDGADVQLSNGVHESGTGSSKTVTRYFGKEAQGDLNGDGRSDVVFLVTQSTGGSGTFYYLVAGINLEKGYQGTQAMLIGDRVSPQSTSVNGKIITVNFNDRKAGQAFTDAPTVQKTLRFQLDGGKMKFTEVTATSSVSATVSATPVVTNAPVVPALKLDSKKWTWTKVTYNDGRVVMPKKTGAFTLTFGADNKFSATTDCNQMGGTYTLSARNQISLGEAYSTKMFCEGSEEDVFAKLLSDVRTYTFSASGGLILGLKSETGSVTFR
jgi:heat shock protein HslJ